MGGRLARALAEDPERHVIALTRRPVPWLPAGVERRLVDLGGPIEAIKDALVGADAVVHLAGASEVRTSHEPDEAVAETLSASRRVAEAALAAGVGRIVYASTVHVYGAAMEPGAVLTEDLVPSPRHLYAVARLASEHILAAGTAGSATELVVLRLTNGVGAPADPSVDRWTLVGNDLCRQAVTEGRLELRTHGAQWRDFVAITDVCRIVAATLPGAHPQVPAGTFNVGSGRPLTVRELAATVQTSCEALTGHRPELVVPPPPVSPPGPYRVSIDRLADVGVRPRDTVRAAVDETIRFCLAHRRAL